LAACVNRGVEMANAVTRTTAKLSLRFMALGSFGLMLVLSLKIAPFAGNNY